MSIGRKLTDKELEKLEKALAKEYKKAKKEMQNKLDVFTVKFDRADRAQRGQLKKGTITKTQYNDWRKGQILRSGWMKEQIRSYADDLVNVNKRAVEIINRTLPSIYAESHNYGTYEAEKKSGRNTGYIAYNRETVSRLLKDNPQLLPKAKLDIPKDKIWNQQKLNSALVQGLMQNESIPKIADRLQKVADMDQNSAIRNARTMVNSAENAGKYDSFRRVAALGVKIVKVWSATLDDRTRDSHAFLDGVSVKLEEEFPNGLMYPSDMSGSAEEVWNCRCELSCDIEGRERDWTDLSWRNTDHFTHDDYWEWKEERKPVNRWIQSGLSKESWRNLPTDRQLYYLDFVNRKSAPVYALLRSEKLEAFDKYALKVSPREYRTVIAAMNERLNKNNLYNCELRVEAIGDYLYDILVLEFNDYVILGKKKIE